jgi:1,4-alpha-glucan branching enzyme
VGDVYRRDEVGKIGPVIRKHHTPHGLVRVTFEVPDRGHTVSLVADFNDWDPTATPLRRRSNGTRSVDLTLRPGSRVRFRYARQDGTFFEDDEADAYESNGFGQRNAIVCASTPVGKRRRRRESPSP